LEHADWAADKGAAAAGRTGELRTAAELHRVLLAGESGPTVMHDLMLPLRGGKANIDHVVVSGRDVWLYDSKVWAPGTYWTFRGRTRRGWGRKVLVYADRKTCSMARESISGFLSAHGVSAVVRRPVLVVWPSNRLREPNLAWYRPVGARAIAGKTLARHCGRARKPAAKDIVDMLARLVVDRSVAPVFDDGWLDGPRSSAPQPEDWPGPDDWAGPDGRA
jgi:hypothetical protein